MKNQKRKKIRKKIRKEVERMQCKNCEYWQEDIEYNNCDCGYCYIYENIETYKDDECKSDEN